MKHVTFVSFSVKLNGESLPYFKPTRGIRQGDTISPYLFIIVANTLSALMKKAIQDSTISSIKLNGYCPILSHLLFADDSIFFLRADRKNCLTFKSILESYCAVSGQQVNVEKSCTFLSKNTPDPVREMVGQTLGFSITPTPGKYLGLPILWERSKVEALAFVRDKIRKKVMGWNKNFLSQGGKETLIKAVANAIPTYSMSCFLYPKKTCQEIDSIIANCWWGEKDGKKKIHWKAWEKVTERKGEGGLGFKDFQNFNLALIGKQCWRLMIEADQLWARIIKGIYFPNSSFLNAKKGPRASWAWSSLLEGREIFLGKTMWRVGEGDKINVWNDPWIPSVDTFCLSRNFVLEGMENLCVADLIVQRKWDIDWLPIPTEIKEEIRNIRLPLTNVVDKLMWSVSSNGQYTVKVGYLWLQEHKKKRRIDEPSTSTPVGNECWKMLWKLRVQPKIKHFLWKACVKAIPTKEALFKRKCGVNPLCVHCDHWPETIEHCLLLCDRIKRIWFASSLHLTVHELNVTSFELWLFNILNVLKNDEYSEWILT